VQRYICIHGHFYQPPRENPWLETIEQQDSAYPYHDWNDRITDECYRPNTGSRILDEQGRIARIINNFETISFNFGPTLLSWMESFAPDVYDAIIEADKRSIERFSGHGSAVAQAYGHMILPLANERDRNTQVLWGIRDFEQRFGRRPEGMWLPETAANTATLETLADHDIGFTILAPRQAWRIRPLDGGKWTEVYDDVDPSRPYLVKLPSGRSIAVFFYDGPISQGVAFEGLLNSGQRFARRLLSGFSDHRDWPQLMHIATDGETYGHHHRHGDMALASALRQIAEHEDVALTNYGEYLERHPPKWQVEIAEDSSWSCVHGVERWRSDCGCHTGGRPDWNQQWRKPLRESLDWLRDTLMSEFESHAAQYIQDPWSARDDYISVVLNRSSDTVNAYFDAHASRQLEDHERVEVLKLMELQRHAMLMYTSCGWFFNELSGIETVQVLQYAGRAIQLAYDVFGTNHEPEFLDHLERAHSNLAEIGTGRDVYDRFVKPAVVDLSKVGAHFALHSLFEETAGESNVYCYDVKLEQSQRDSAGKAQIHVGKVRLTSRITGSSALLCFGALHLGEHIMNAAIRADRAVEDFDTFVSEALEAFHRADFTSLFRLFDSKLGGPGYSLASLFRDEQRRVVDSILRSTLDEVEGTYRQLYEHHAPLTRFLSGLDVPVPRALQLPAEFVLNVRLREALAEEHPDPASVRELLDEAREQSVQLDQVTLPYTAEHVVDRLVTHLMFAPRDAGVLTDIRAIVEVLHELPFEVDLADLQNAFYDVMNDERRRMHEAATGGDENAQEWMEAFESLGDLLNMRLSELESDDSSQTPTPKAQPA